MPYEALHIYEVDEARRELVPVLARSQAYEDEIMKSRPRFGEGITGWAVENRQPVLDESRAPRSAGGHRPGHADRARGADRRPADRARRAQGRAQHLPDRRGRGLRRARVRAREVVRRRRRARARQRADPRAPRAPRADGLAHRSLQPPLLPRAPALRADACVSRRTTRSRC